MRTLLKSDDGAVAVVAGVSLLALLMLSALVVDVGYWYNVRRQLQAAADAGALAGCQELINTSSPSAANALAEEYAMSNDDRPADGMVVDEVQVGSDYVTVKTAKDAPAWLAGLFGSSGKRITATAKAVATPLSGVRRLVPWALPIIDVVDRVEVAIVSGKTVLGTWNLSSVDDVTYSGAITAPIGPGSYDVRVRVYNTHGIWEGLVDNEGKDIPAARLTVPEPTAVISGVSLSRAFVNAQNPEPVLVTVRTSSPQAKMSIKLGNKAKVMTPNASGTEFTYMIGPVDMPPEDDLLTLLAVDAYPGSKDDGVDAYVLRRRTTHVIGGVDVGSPTGQFYVASGSSVPVKVNLHEYANHVHDGTLYTLRVAGGSGEVGNYCELNFKAITHLPGCPPDAPGAANPLTPETYYGWTAYGYDLGIHVGDVITTSPGNSGANTQKALDFRFARLSPEERVVHVPIVEKIEAKKGGAYDVKVVNYGAFRVTDYGKDGSVRGYFLQYTPTPGSYGPGGGGPGYSSLGARLVMP